MKNKSALNKMDILLFQATDNLIKQSPLKNFIHFLNYYGIKKPIKFSYIDEEGPLLANLTLRENIYLDSVPLSFSDTKEFQLRSFLEKSGNKYLTELFENIRSLDKYPKQVDNQTRKLAALIKGLIQKAEYLFLSYPEKYLEEGNLTLFTKAIEFQTINLGQIVFIHSQNEKIWSNHISKRVTRGPNFKFEIVPAVHRNSTANSSQNNDQQYPAKSLRFNKVNKVDAA